MAGSSLTITDLDSGTTTKHKATTKSRAKRATKKTASTSKTKSTQSTPVTAKATPKKTATKAAQKKTTRKTKTTKSTKKAAKKTTRKASINNATKKTTATTSRSPRGKASGPEKRSPRQGLGERTTTPRKREPLGHLLVEQLLREAGFAGLVTTKKATLDRYSTDESVFAIRPQIVLQPKNQRDIEIAVKTLGENVAKFPSLSLTPRAAGTGLSGGSLTDSVVIDVCKFMHTIDEPKTKKDAVTITVEPGAMWRDVEKILKQKGVYLPSYPASKDLCSIGGSIANNAAGPDSLRYGHCADWVESLNVTLYDGNTYTLKPITYKEFKTLTGKDNALATILTNVLKLIEENESEIDHAKPKTKKNSAGYPLWDVIDGSVASFKRGKATLDLTRLISGSQGTIGIITSITLKTEPIKTDTELIVVPVFDLMDAGNVIVKALDYDPINVELFDGLTFNLALQNPQFFKDRLSKTAYCRTLLSMYTLYHVRYLKKVPEFTLLITLDKRKGGDRELQSIVAALRAHHGKKARVVKSPIEKEMFWQIRRASYTLSKFQDPKKRPAAFLEDMTVPPQNLSKFFVAIKKLLKKYNVTAAVHGHGGNGHLHFYPLLDFTQKGTAQLVEKMAEEFFSTAVQFDGNICGEHNDGIIRTPHLNKMFSSKVLKLFAEVEHIFDPHDLFNPGKKVNPRFDVKESLRHTN